MIRQQQLDFIENKSRAYQTTTCRHITKNTVKCYTPLSNNGTQKKTHVTDTNIDADYNPIQI